ncbi:thiolase family protein [Hellea sp.]|nr:thiolase family protein [Hellea sp.]MDA8889165.1 thiolase family protein [Hellea sp.]MDB4845243.1 thiolase family protein [Hellea sp.]MDC1088761.1 thiolase family protein [Hellea sp.]
MKQNAYIAGVGMTQFGKHLDRSFKSLAYEAINAALKDACIEGADLNAAYIGNVGAGVISGQTCVPGQIILREMGIGGIPVINVENACASSATAFEQACTMVTLGAYDVVLAGGVEKLYSEDKQKTFDVFSGGIDIEKTDEILSAVGDKLRALGMDVDEGAGANRSVFVDIYVAWALDHMKKYGTTREQMAAVSAKNSYHGSLNPYAQYRDLLTIEDVLGSREVVWPLTLPMCSPIGDGASATIVVSEKKAKQLGLADMVRVEACTLSSGYDYDEGSSKQPPRIAANAIYEVSGIGPQDLDCIELHDASAISEIMYYEYLGLCGDGKGGQFIDEGHSRLGGKIPVNTSGGLMRKGHPIGATGTSQITELVWQLRGQAEGRQVENARIALAENGGGYIGSDVAALVLTILSKK